MIGPRDAVAVLASQVIEINASCFGLLCEQLIVVWMWQNLGVNLVHVELVLDMQDWMVMRWRTRPEKKCASTAQ